MAHGTQETEIKLAVRDARGARRRLLAAGFAVSRPRVFEANTVFDTADMTLRQSSRLLRLRQAGREVTLTYKGVPESGRHKVREELEVDGRRFHGDERRSSAGWAISRCSATKSTAPSSGSRDARASRQWTRRRSVCFWNWRARRAWIDRTARTLGFDEDALHHGQLRAAVSWSGAPRTRSSPGI